MSKTFLKTLLGFFSFFCAASFLIAKPKVNLSVWADDGTSDIVSKRLNEFKAANREVNFNFTVIEQASAFCSTNIMANIEFAADVFVFVDDQLADLVENGIILELPYDYSQKVMDLCGGANAAGVSAASKAGKLYAFPQLAGNGYFLFYNKKYITADDTASFSKLLKAAAASDKQVAMDLKNGWYLYSFFKAAGLDVYSEGNGNFCNWNATDTKYKGVDVAKAIINIASDPAFVSADNGGIMDLVKSGKVVAAINGPWNAVFFSSEWGADYGAVKLPTYNVKGNELQMSSFMGFKMVGVKASAKNPEWAMKVAAWLSDEKTQLEIFKKKGEPPAALKVAESPEVRNSPVAIALSEQSKFSSVQRVNSSYWNPSLVLGVVLSDGKSLSDKEIQIHLDNTVKKIRK